MAGRRGIRPKMDPVRKLTEGSLPGFHKKMYQITWCAQPGGADYLVFTKFAPDYLVPQKRGDQITWATFGHKVDQITW